jgi:hypothetical protein
LNEKGFPGGFHIALLWLAVSGKGNALLSKNFFGFGMK